MTSGRLPRHWTLLLLIYIIADFTDPSVPGVFFFDNDALFVDGAVQAKSDTTHLVTPELVPLGGPAHDGEIAAATRQVVSRPSRPQCLSWKNLKRDDSSSFESASPPDSSPTPPSS